MYSALSSVLWGSCQSVFCAALVGTVEHINVIRMQSVRSDGEDVVAGALQLYFQLWCDWLYCDSACEFVGNVNDGLCEFAFEIVSCSDGVRRKLQNRNQYIYIPARVWPAERWMQLVNALATQDEENHKKLKNFEVNTILRDVSSCQQMRHNT